jgi:hypothetical protein
MLIDELLKNEITLSLRYSKNQLRFFGLNRCALPFANAMRGNEEIGMSRAIKRCADLSVHCATIPESYKTIGF